jgi:hypothetical protein
MPVWSETGDARIVLGAETFARPHSGKKTGSRVVLRKPGGN